MASVYALDFHKEYINKNVTDHQTVWIGRYSILIMSAIAYLLALFAPSYLITIGLFSLSGLAQVVVPTIGALFWARSTKQGATVGMIVGFFCVWAFQFGWLPLPGPFAIGGGGLLGLMINAVLFIVVSLLTPPRPAELIDEINEQYKGYYEE
jgi:SSS family solute:Na+ symporter